MDRLTNCDFMSCAQSSRAKRVNNNIKIIKICKINKITGNMISKGLFAKFDINLLKRFQRNFIKQIFSIILL